MNNSKKIITILYILTFAVLLTACGKKKTEEATQSTIEIFETMTTEAEKTTEVQTEVSEEDTTESTDTALIIDTAEPQETGTEEVTEEESREYRFKNHYRLQDHYEKHGKEMGFPTAEEYEKAASAVVNNKAALHKTEKEDGDDVYYIEETNEFVVVSTDGYIRTYFNPDKGIEYFNRQ